MISELYYRCSQCRRCALWETRTNLVFGDGNPNASVMFVGEGPGENEDLTGRPFVGRGGQLLTDMLAYVDLVREKNFYIANIVKCRPPKNRDPMPEEQKACMGWLREQMEIIKPKIVVCLGRISAMALIKPDFRISQEHGLVFDKDGVKYMALFHPAALLRDPRRRPETFIDLKNLQKLITEVAPETYR